MGGEGSSSGFEIALLIFFTNHVHAAWGQEPRVGHANCLEDMFAHICLVVALSLGVLVVGLGSGAGLAEEA